MSSIVNVPYVKCNQLCCRIFAPIAVQFTPSLCTPCSRLWLALITIYRRTLAFTRVVFKAASAVLASLRTVGASVTCASPPISS